MIHTADRSVAELTGRLEVYSAKREDPARSGLPAPAQ